MVDGFRGRFEGRILDFIFTNYYRKEIARNYQKFHPVINNGDNIADATKTLKASSLIRSTSGRFRSACRAPSLFGEGGGRGRRKNRGYERSEHPRLVVAVSVSTLQGRPFIAGAPL